MDDRKLTPKEVRKLIREEKITGQTSGLCPGYAQANLLILPKDQAYDFLLFTQRNPRACPILEVTDMGSRQLHYLAQDADVARDFPKYRIYRKGEMIGEYTSIDRFWQDNFVSFLIGCSFSFEAGLLEADVPVRQIEEHKNVPMYKTNIPCIPAGIFHGNMVVSMRPMTGEQAVKASCITGEMPRVHGAPVHIGDPSQIGIRDLQKPDFGEAVTIREGELPVFWPCGVTPQNVVMEVKPELAITHAPGHMFISDIKNAALKY